jgi:hypothetical protein
MYVVLTFACNFYVQRWPTDAQYLRTTIRNYAWMKLAYGAPTDVGFGGDSFARCIQREIGEDSTADGDYRVPPPEDTISYHYWD